MTINSEPIPSGDQIFYLLHLLLEDSRRRHYTRLYARYIQYMCSYPQDSLCKQLVSLYGRRGLKETRCSEAE